ncbi:MAG: TspO/MBR family protein [Gammaproteobacteria bacterium]
MRRYVSLLFTLAVIGVNAAANILPINGVNTGEISARYPTGFTPAGWVFSIWGLIYIGLAAFSIYAARPTPETAARIRQVEPVYWISCVANGLWIFMWHHERILESLLLMFVLLGSLIVIYVRLRSRPALSLTERLCVDAPFSLYFGWISTAVLANLAAWFFAMKIYPFGLSMDEWAILVVVTATAIYTAVGVRTHDAVYTAVFCWASLGIVLQTLETDPSVRLAAAAACAVMVVVTAVSALSARAASPLSS